MPLPTFHVSRRLVAVAAVVAAAALTLAPAAHALKRLGLPGENWRPAPAKTSFEDRRSPGGLPAPPESATCPVLPSTKAYARFGDDADYTPAPGGTFEDRDHGWKQVSFSFSRKNTDFWTSTALLDAALSRSSHARLVPWNDPHNIAPGRRSVLLNPSSMLVSPRFCVDLTHPHFRFSFAPIGRRFSFAFSVRVLYYGRSGEVVEADIADVLSSDHRGMGIHRGWRLAPPSPLATLMEGLNDQSAMWAHIFVVPERGSVLLDNVMVDPHRRR